VHLEVRSRLNPGIACYFLWMCNWSITLREEYGLRMCENRVLRKIFVPGGGDIREG
jgi:hypothetical protein